MSGGRGQRAALAETGTQLGELLRRALADKIARRTDRLALLADERQDGDERGLQRFAMASRGEQDLPLRDRGELT
ncbi:MAG: hypothetical protein ACK4ZU_00280 [Allorhizobium sp.]